MIALLFPAGTGTVVVFWICAVLAIAGAVGVISFRKPVYSALSLALVMVSLAVIYASLNAPFLFVVQIIVYTGAVLMLFLFVIMLVGVKAEDSLVESLKGHRIAAGVVGVAVLALLVLAVGQGITSIPVGLDQANAGGNVQGIAQLIFQKYVIAFEATAALLITAAVAAMVLAHPTRLRPKLTQKALAAKRLEAYAEAGVHPGTRPSSGVFARHNSIATPALLPDGTIAADSVSQVLQERVALPSPESLSQPHALTAQAMGEGGTAVALLEATHSAVVPADVDVPDDEGSAAAVTSPGEPVEKGDDDE